jgi:hypothetical protein
MFTPMVCLPAQSLPAGLTTANRASPPSDVIFQKASSSSVLTQAFGPYQAGSLEIIIPAGSNDGVFPGAKVRVLATPLSMDGTVDHVERRRAFVYVQRGSFPPSPKVDGAFIPTTECLEL